MRQAAASAKTAKFDVEKQYLEAAPRKGRRPGYVLYAPWRGLAERPWFDALFFGALPMARRRIKTIAQESNRGAMSFPFDAATWVRVVEVLGLPPQQARIVERLLCGMCDKQIALDLSLSVPTVRTYLGRIFDRLGVRDRVQLILRVFSIASEAIKS